jgi:ribosomal protein S18 acetylase RimI-like enzyme
VKMALPVLRGRGFASESDLRLMQDVVQESWRAEKPRVRFHIGDLAWGYYQHAGREHEWRIRLWETNGRPVGWAWLHLPDTAELFALPAHRRDVIPEMAAWLREEAAAAGAERLAVSALDQDRLTVEALLAAGFEPTDEPPFDSMALSLGGALPERRLPDGFRVRHVSGEEDVARRVAVHRATWSVFAPSRVTETSYQNVMAAWPYRPELDWVVEASDGTFVSSCLVWLDEENAVGELEPVGTDPAYWRRGFGFAACATALRALREAGADTAVVNCIEVDGKPSAPALYRALGFERIGRHITLARSLVTSQLQ